MSYCYEYPRPALCVDVIVINDDFSHVLLIQRKNNPYADSWAFPGGFVDENEDLPDAALRELNEETGLSDIALKQFKTYGTPGRDPRGHVVSVVYYGICPKNTSFAAADDAKDVQWFPLQKLPILAFDHKQIMHDFLVKIMHNLG
ncbi:MAG: NUDIX hydrolase [Bacteroidales bacterium]|nr:NUDIX hydrolase [Bacteroidales bacterium]MDY0217100.1 NUDIX hydrolase [Bacteroidales bacterium]